MSLDDLREWMPQLLIAAGGTLRMTALAYLVAVVAGLLLALARLSRRSVLAGAAGCYIELIRGTPALTQLFLIYFGLASAGFVLSAFTAAVIGLGLNYAAYMAEVYRAGIVAVHRGQREAALAIGMTNALAMRAIILPQAIRIIVPPIASLISAPELMLRARDLSSEYFLPMQLYLLVGAMYLVMAYPLAKGARYLELRLAAGRASG